MFNRWERSVRYNASFGVSTPVLGTPRYEILPAPRNDIVVKTIHNAIRMKDFSDLYIKARSETEGTHTFENKKH